MALLAETKAITGSIGIRVDAVPGPKEIDALLRRLKPELQDFRPAWRRITREVLLPELRQRFASQTDPDGEKWVRLTPDYADRKIAHGYPDETLVREGHLKASLTRTQAGASGARIIKKKFALIGTDLPYALPLQWGYGKTSFSALFHSEKGRRRVRKSRSRGLRSDVFPRRFIGWNSPMRERSTSAMVEHLEALVAKQARDWFKFKRGGA